MNLIKFDHSISFNEMDVYPNVKFSENKWRIQWSSSEHILIDFEQVKLEKTRLVDLDDLCLFTKMLTYYNFPKKFNLRITSWSTTGAMFSALKQFLQNFAWPHQLVTSNLISSVTQQQISTHVDFLIEKLKLNTQGCLQEYRSFVHVIRVWSKLSEEKLLPEAFCLNVNIDLIFTKKMINQAQDLCNEVTSTWLPLEPEVIELCYKNSKTYLYDYAKTIIKCQDIIRNRPTVGVKSESFSQVRKDGKTKDIFKTLVNMDVPKIDEENKLFNFVPKTKKVKSLGYASGYQDRTTVNINEIRPEVIQLKRACIFIIGLFTGMRRREIAELKATPAFKKNNDWYLAITRFKTSDDAAEFGEPDEIPIPTIVKDAVDTLIKLFENNRTIMNSEYLLVSDLVTTKAFEKIKIDTIGKDVSRFIEDTTGVSGHTHQLRKTIAWLLISRSEKNVELIRQLFGHKSYGMTLRYILRNSLLVQNVMELIEHNYTEDLSQIFKDIVDGKTAGNLSDNIKQRMHSQKYKGQILATDIESFIKETIRSGIPLFISKLPIGAFCIKAGDSSSLPPCMAKTKEQRPNIEFCNYKECDCVLHTNESKVNINKQIGYYKQKLSYLTEDSDEKLVCYYENEISEHESLLERLNEQAIDVDVIYG